VNTTWDALIVGAGIMGRSAAWQLARAGLGVLVVDQFSPTGGPGSSHGGTRSIRRSYEDPTYAALAGEAEARWRSMEREAAVTLLRRTGGLDLGTPGSPSFDATLRTIRQLGVSYELPDRAEVESRWGLAPSAHLLTLYQPDAGLIDADGAMRTMLHLGEAAGVSYLWRTRVACVDEEASGCTVLLGDAGDAGRLRASNVVVCAGPWTERLVGLPVDLSVLRCEPVYLDVVARPCREARPLFYIHPDEGFPDGVYVQPQSESGGRLRLKVGRHNGLPVTDPDTHVPELVEDWQTLQDRMSAAVGGEDAGYHGRDTCFYTMSPDEKFIIDSLPDCKRVTVAAGFSGHGFKFAPLLGEIVARRITGTPRAETAAFELSRF
jgi:sarcosine oxidase